MRFLSDLLWSSSVLEFPIECQNLMFCFIILVDSSVACSFNSRKGVKAQSNFLIVVRHDDRQNKFLLLFLTGQNIRLEKRCLACA